LRESEKIPENAKSVFILTPSLQKDCLINYVTGSENEGNKPRVFL